jgi:preprotein translocase subunit YajC
MYPLITPAYAQAADGGMIAQFGSFLPLILIFVAFYFIMIRPQQQEQKKLKLLIAAVKKGDRVLTAGGIVGTVQKARDGAPEIEVEIAPNVRVTVMRDTLSSVLNAQTPTVANDSK